MHQHDDDGNNYDNDYGDNGNKYDDDNTQYWKMKYWIDESKNFPCRVWTLQGEQAAVCRP